MIDSWEFNLWLILVLKVEEVACLLERTSLWKDIERLAADYG